VGVSIVATIIYVAASLFILVMWIRLVFDLIGSFSRSWRPRGFWLVAAEASFAVTDPLVKGVRRIVPPLRLGGITLDLAWSIVLLAAIVLSYIAGAFI
jgi:YggT family protein